MMRSGLIIIALIAMMIPGVVAQDNCHVNESESIPEVIGPSDSGCYSVNGSGDIHVLENWSIEIPGAHINVSAGTNITPPEGKTVDMTQLNASDVDIAELGAPENGYINHSIEFGLPEVGLNFTKPITIALNLSEIITEKEAFDIFKSHNTNGPWNQSGLLNENCTVTIEDPICEFQTEKASYFATGSLDLGEYNLTINSTQGGNVTIPGEGVFNYTNGTVVNITAEANDSYAFDKWTGDTGTIRENDSADTEIGMDDNYEITANFSEVVEGDGVIVVPGDYDKIQSAVDNSIDGYKIIVNSGVYNESVVVDRSITLIGNDTGTGKPIINGTNNGSVLDLGADGVVLENFYINNSGGDDSDAGIKIVSDHNKIHNNTIANNSNGVLLNEANNNTINNNKILNNHNDGVNIGLSNNNTIESNNITQNSEAGVVVVNSVNNTIQYNNVTQTGGGENVAGGIKVYKNPSTAPDSLDTLDNSILNNTISQNSDGGVSIGMDDDYRDTGNITVRGNTFIDDGLIVYEGYNLTIENNTVNGDPLIYKKGFDNQTIGENTNASQIILHECKNVTIKDQNITNTDLAIELYRTNQTTVTNNTLQKNYVGVALWSSSNNTIQDNNITETMRAGIYLETPGIIESEPLRTRNNIIKNNNIIDNNVTDYAGIRIRRSYNTTIEDNKLLNNNIGVTIWSHDETSYWTSWHDNNIIQNNNITENNKVGINLYVDTYNNTIQDNQIQDNGDGVRCYGGWFNTIQNNTIADNTQHGIWLREGVGEHMTSENNTIQDNHIQNNANSGILIDKVFNNTIRENNITGYHEYGVLSHEAEDNVLYLNNFKVDTGANVHSEASDNSWVSPNNINYTYNGSRYYKKLGNYYDGYNGADPDGDGIGNSSYGIEGDNNDSRPLMNSTEEYWLDKIDCDGTAIYNWSDLDKVRDDLSADYCLMNDLDENTAGYTELASENANSGAGWDPIGTFTGTFDGNGHEISGLYINRPGTSDVGLFGYVDGAEVTDVGVIDVNITGNGYVGGLIGENYGSDVSNSHSTGNVTGASGTVGGLIGHAYGSNVVDSSSTGNVEADGSYVGGLIGDSGAINISNSYSVGDVNGTGDNVGGLIGEIYESGKVIHSSSIGKVKGSGSDVGGLIGLSAASVVNSYSEGDVNGTGDVGGLIGYTEGNVSDSYSSGNVTGSGDYVGGLIGESYGNITDSYSEGDVNGSGSYYFGGLIGYSEGDVSDSYSIGNVTGSGDVGGLIGGDYGDVTNTSSTGDVTGSGDYVGGLIGGNYEGDVNNSHSTGDVTGASGTVGGLIGYTEDDVSNAHTTGNVTGNGDYVGGLIGESYADITDSYSEGYVNGSGNYYFGGLIGYSEGDVSDSYSTGYVTGTGDVGGLIGGSKGDVSNSSSTGDVTGIDYVGGFIGESYGNITDSYSEGKVNGTNYVGGLIGYNEENVSDSYSVGDVVGNDSVGGLIGLNLGNVSDTYSVGNVTGNYSVGGFIGNNSGTVSHSYWNNETSGQPEGVGDGDNTGVYARTTKNMTWNYSADTYEGWDMNKTEGEAAWLSGDHELVEDHTNESGYPALGWQELPYFEVDITGYNESVNVGDEVLVKYTVTNTGGKGTQDILFSTNDTSEDNHTSISLGPDETYSAQFTWNASKAGKPLLMVYSDDDHENITVTVVKEEFIPVSVEEKNGTNEGTIEKETEVGSGGSSVLLEKDTVVSGSSEWDGKIREPTTKDGVSENSTGPSYSDQDTQDEKVVEVGSNTTQINLSLPAKIVMEGEAGKNVGWTRAGEAFHEIMNTCDADFNNATAAKDFLEEEEVPQCKKDVGENLTIWTTHFTEFVTYTTSDTEDDPDDGGGSTGGGGLAPPSCESNWTCTDWSECADGVQLRECTDQNDCDTETNKPDTKRTCTVETDENVTTQENVTAENATDDTTEEEQDTQVKGEQAANETGEAEAAKDDEGKGSPIFGDNFGTTSRVITAVLVLAALTIIVGMFMRGGKTRPDYHVK